jgi:carbon starvation protein CstA
MTSLPALIIGTVILSAYSMYKIRPGAVDDKERVALLLTVFGFAYQIIGAWPLGIKAIFLWEWQKQIISFGTIFAWTLTVLSLLALVAGGVSLFTHSKLYHHKHPQFNQIIIEN